MYTDTHAQRSHICTMETSKYRACTKCVRVFVMLKLDTSHYTKEEKITWSTSHVHKSKKPRLPPTFSDPFRAFRARESLLCVRMWACYFIRKLAPCIIQTEIAPNKPLLCRLCSLSSIGCRWSPFWHVMWFGEHRARNIKSIFAPFMKSTSPGLDLFQIETEYDLICHLPGSKNRIHFLLNTPTKDVGGEKNSRCHRLVTKRSLRRCQCEGLYTGVLCGVN